MNTTIVKVAIVALCVYSAMMTIGCGGGGGGDETASTTTPPTSTTPPTTAPPTTAPPTSTAPKNYATIDELAADMKTPEALGAWIVQNISYLYPLNMDMANWKYLNPNQVFSGRKGDCIHVSAFIKEILTKNGLFLQTSILFASVVLPMPFVTGRMQMANSGRLERLGVEVRHLMVHTIVNVP